MSSQPSHWRLSRIRCNGSSGADVSIRRRRRIHRCLIPISALTCLSIHESSSLIIPTQHYLSPYHTSSSTGIQYRSSYLHKRRRRDVSNTVTDNDIRSIFQLYFAPPDSCNYDNDAHLVHSERYNNINFERCERQQQMVKRRDYNAMSATLSSVRCSTYLCMAQSSESNGDGKNEDKKKKETKSNINGGSDASSSNNKRKDGGRAGISKGSNKQPKQQQQRTRRKKKNGKKKQQQNISKGKSNRSSRSKSTIKTSGENTSLKGFKSEQQPPVNITEEGSKNSKPKEGDTEVTLQKRVIQLESIVSNQMTEIQKYVGRLMT